MSVGQHKMFVVTLGAASAGLFMGAFTDKTGQFGDFVLAVWLYVWMWRELLQVPYSKDY